MARKLIPSDGPNFWFEIKFKWDVFCWDKTDEASNPIYIYIYKGQPSDKCRYCGADLKQQSNESLEIVSRAIDLLSAS